MDNDFLMDLENFEQISEIGMGATSHTYKYKKKGTQEFYCVKIFINRLSSVEEQKRFDLEISIMRESKHPSVISLCGYNYALPGNDRPIIITKFYPKSLENYIKRTSNVPLAENPPNISLSKRYIIILGIAEAMKYLNSKDVVHRDLKPANILLDENDYPIICDFGISKLESQVLRTGLGTPQYMAPEIDVDDEENHRYTNKVDVFSFAILFYELYVLGPAYPDFVDRNQAFSLYTKVQKGKRPNLDLIDKKIIKDFIEKCWDKDPNNRPSFDEIVDQIKMKEFQEAMEADENEVTKYLSIIEDPLENQPDSLNDIKQQAIAGDVNKMLEYTDIMYKKLNKTEALKFYNMAANNTNAKASRLYALLLIEMYKDENHISEASKHIKFAAENGDFEALQTIIQNPLFQYDTNEIIGYYKKCADNENADACFIYANMLYDGDAIKQNKEEALEYFIKAANKGNLVANLRAALMLEEGDGVIQKKDKAEIYFRNGINKNDADTIFYYAFSILKSGYSEIRKNELVDNFKLSANLQNVNGMLCYAIILQNGYFDVQRKLIEAKDLIDKAKKASTESSAKLSFNIASQIFRGEINKFVTKDAVLFLKNAAENGNIDAMYYYSLYLYANGEEETNDDDDDTEDIYVKAISLFKKAINNMHPEAIIDQTYMLNKFGDKIFEKKSKDCYIDGLKEATIRIIIKNAKIVPRDEALKYLNWAIKMGSQKARGVYCEVHGIFHNMFYQIEEVRVNYKKDEIEHAIAVIVNACTKENKKKLIRHLKKIGVQNINDTFNEIDKAYYFVYNKRLDGNIIRKILNDFLEDSDF